MNKFQDAANETKKLTGMFIAMKAVSEALEEMGSLDQKREEIERAVDKADKDLFAMNQTLESRGLEIEAKESELSEIENEIVQKKKECQEDCELLRKLAVSESEKIISDAKANAQIVYDKSEKAAEEMRMTLAAIESKKQELAVTEAKIEKIKQDAINAMK